MAWIWGSAGALLVTIGLLGVFLAVLHYEASGFLSQRLRRIVWRCIRWLTRYLPQSLRGFVLSLGAPLMVAATITLWAGLEIVGFGLLYYAGLNPENFAFSTSLQPTLDTALYLSAVTLATLGYGDLTPTAPLYEFLTTAEALAGFSLLTLSISFVLSMYQIRQQFSSLAVWLADHAADPAMPSSMLPPYLAEERVQSLENVIRTLHQELARFSAGIRRHSTAYYFHSRELYRSTPYLFYVTGDLVATLRWVLPEGHPASQAPTLTALMTRYADLKNYIEQHFLSQKRPEAPAPLSFIEFVATLESDAVPRDPWLVHFLNTRPSLVVPPDQRNPLAISLIQAYHSDDDQQQRPAAPLEPVGPVNTLVPSHACLPHWWQLACPR